MTDDAEFEIVESVLDAAIERLVERIIRQGGDPTEIDDETWLAMVVAESGI